jgi:hypothetical protein
MVRLFVLMLAAITAFMLPAMAAPESDRIRGTIAAVDPSGVTVQTREGEKVTVALSDATEYVTVVKSSLANVEKGSFIGTSTKGSGDFLVALEVHIFPPSMRGAGEGHYGWDALPDTTLAGGGTVASAMTNGTVQAVTSKGPGTAVNTTMTNGDVGSVSQQGGAERITVTYNGGEQTILVPPTAPIVAFEPADHSAVVTGAHVFIRGSKDGGKVTADEIAIGKGGLTPPM